MGIEVYLLKVHFKDALSEKKLRECLEREGFKIVSGDGASVSYELKTRSGITEIQSHVKRNLIPSFYVRFSVINPDTIIKQTIGILIRLSKEHNIKIEDWETEEVVSSPQKHLDKIKRKMIEKRTELLSNKGIILKPIHGGKETFDYIHNHKLK